MYVKQKPKDNKTASVFIKGVNKDKFFEILDIVKSIDGRIYNTDSKTWTVPITEINLKTLKAAGFSIDKKLSKTLSTITRRKTRKVNLDPIKHLPLYPFQFDGVKYIERRDGRALLGDEMGLGKTIQAIAYLKLHPELRPAVIVCPASLKLNWKKEIKKWTGEESFCIFGRKEIEPVLNWPFYIINYDILSSHIDFLLNKSKILVADECHYIKNPKAARTKHFKKLSRKMDKIIAISGTPITSRPAEFFTILNILDPHSWNNNWKFLERYCKLQHNGFGWEAKGATNTEELHEKLTETIMIRRTKNKVLKDLPQKIRSVVYIPMDEQNKYASKKDKLFSQIQSGDISKNTMVLSEIESLKQLAVNLKMKYVIEWIENFIASGEKLVIFATHHFVIDKLKETFSDICVSLDGRTPQLERQEVVENFQNNLDIKLFIGNIKAAGVGITLTAASNTVFIELGWTPGEHDQAEDRIHRIGQKSDSVTAWYLIAQDTIEEEIIELIDEKRKNLDAILDGKITEDSSLLSELIKRIKGEL